MAQVRVTQNLYRHVPETAESVVVSGLTVHDVLEAYFEIVPQLRGYVLDDSGGVRKHMTIFIDGSPIADRGRLSDPASEASEIFIMQALSGG
ncbi:MAG: MoaD/ThiS family protein [Verrucomicrobiae bacterium]|nr:MoaD/ThiS family protein [Verrucomicrobiae bacterium]